MSEQLRRVLLIHDDPDSRAALQEALEGHDFEVKTAASAAVAIRDLRTVDPDVVVCRNRMPVLGGRHVIRAVAAADGELPVVVLAEEGDLALVVELMRLGATDCVLDPDTDPGAVVGAVERAAVRSRSRRQARSMQEELNEAHARMARLLEQDAVIRERAFERVAEPLERAGELLRDLGQGELSEADKEVVQDVLMQIYAIGDALSSAQTDATRTSTRSVALEDFHPQDVAEFVRDAVLREAHGRGVEVATFVPANLVPVRGDPQQLRAALVDLASFLIARRRGGVVHLAITVEERGSGPWLIRFDVSDSDGPDPVRGDDVIERYLPREDVATVREDLIDLSMTARAVTLLGGELELYEQRGVGMRFSFDLALLQAKRQTEALVDPRLNPADVLLAEPTGQVRRCVANELMKLGMRCSTAGTADQAVSALKRAVAAGALPRVAFVSLALPERASLDAELDKLGGQVRRVYLARAGEYAPSMQDSLTAMRPPRRNVLIEVLRKAVGSRDEG